MNKIAVIDYGMGNLHSVGKALEKVSNRTKVIISSDEKEINKADKIVLPGVGAIKECLRSLEEKGLDRVVLQNIKEKPTLAICVGMQLLFESSEENQNTRGLSILEGKVSRIPNNSLIKIPHMGWNRVKQVSDHYMWSGISENSFFYFVHSYCCKKSKYTVGMTTHGLEFVSALAQGTIFAVQFHPEKSQKAGLQLYQNFINWNVS
mgnify:FL=1